LEDAATRHGTQKPVEAMRRPMMNNSIRGDTVYDPFAGSGTTLVAAETIGRTCLAMELDAAYCDMIIRRWEAFTGKQAVRMVGQTA
jgi:DNA modification methylase